MTYSYYLTFCVDDGEYIPSKKELELCFDILYKFGMIDLKGEKNYNSIKDTNGTIWEDINWELLHSNNDELLDEEDEEEEETIIFNLISKTEFFNEFYEKIIDEFKNLGRNENYIDKSQFNNEYSLSISNKSFYNPMLDEIEGSYQSKFILAEFILGNGNWEYEDLLIVENVFQETYSDIISELEQCLDRKFKVIISYS